MKQMLMLGLFGAVLVLVWPAWAEMDGNAWMQQSEEFKRGYAAGHLDTETVWGTSLLPGGAFSEERARTLEVISSVTRYIAVCVRQNNLTSDQLKAMTDTYLRSHPTKVKELMFITIGSALGQVCRPNEAVEKPRSDYPSVPLG